MIDEFLDAEHTVMVEVQRRHHMTECGHQIEAAFATLARERPDAATPPGGHSMLAISFASRLKSRCIDEQVRRMCITFRRPIKTENWAHETGGYARSEADSCTAARMLFDDPVRAAGRWARHGRG
jgi:hypothetical protein